MNNQQSYKIVSTVLLVFLLLIMAWCSTNPFSSVPQALKDLTQTRRALNGTATYFATYPRPHPSMTYFGECQYMGVSSACTAEAPRLFDGTAERFQYQGTYAVRTLTAQATPPPATPGG